MATKIFDVEIDRIPQEFCGLGEYQSALFLIRYRSYPIGQFRTAVRNAQISGREVCEKVVASFGTEAFQAWSHASIPDAGAVAARSISEPVTIAICTRDRPDDLRNCLASLRSLPDDGQEIVVIDNCPRTEDSKAIVAGFPAVRYVREIRPGLDCARNRALREARGDVVAFIDDDARADKSWLRALIGGFCDRLVLAVTGLTMPLELETEPQETFERLSGFSRGFKRRRFSLDSHSPAAGGAAGAGANMALRRDILARVGGFDEALDAGTPTKSGGDAEMFMRILARGYDIVYEPGALNWHRHRRTEKELLETFYGYGTGLYSAWLRTALIEREWSTFRSAWRWFFKEQLRKGVRSLLRRPDAYPFNVIRAEIAGSFAAPLAYWRACRALKRKL